jgi:hypothetical protein
MKATLVQPYPRFATLPSAASISPGAPRFGTAAEPPGSEDMPEEGKKGFNIVDRFMDGLSRVGRMTFLRPTGLIELAFLHSWAFIGSWILPLKHFAEGVLHVDSIAIPRMPSPFGFLSQHRKYGRTFLQMLQGKPERAQEN